MCRPGSCSGPWWNCCLLQLHKSCAPYDEAQNSDVHISSGPSCVFRPGSPLTSLRRSCWTASWARVLSVACELSANCCCRLSIDATRGHDHSDLPCQPVLCHSWRLHSPPIPTVNSLLQALTPCLAGETPGPRYICPYILHSILHSMHSPALEDHSVLLPAHNTTFSWVWSRLLPCCPAGAHLYTGPR